MNDLLEPVLGAERWPPMLGVVGFDGGYKSAVALAIPPEGLVAGEGEFGPGEGIGACCYDDGTCDDISEFDCTSALGTYQGDGTDCASVSCTGVCCEPGCVDDTTPDGCALDGGTFQGFGTTCADDPPPCPEPTGACCVGSDCSIETEDDCTGMGGTYQGDDTTCDPNPCLPTCDCGFDAFDGSGRKFLTKTTAVTANASYDTSAGCPQSLISTSNWSSTTVETYDPDTCSPSCASCSGSGAYAYHIRISSCTVPFDDVGSLTSSACLSGPTVCGAFSENGYEQLSGCRITGSARQESLGCTTCGGTLTVDSATQTTTVYACDPSSITFFHATVVVTLSDECIPPGGAFSDPFFRNN